MITSTSERTKTDCDTQQSKIKLLLPSKIKRDKLCNIDSVLVHFKDGRQKVSFIESFNEIGKTEKRYPGRCEVSNAKLRASFQVCLNGHVSSVKNKNVLN